MGDSKMANVFGHNRFNDFTNLACDEELEVCQTYN